MAKLVQYHTVGIFGQYPFNKYAGENTAISTFITNGLGKHTAHVDCTCTHNCDSQQGGQHFRLLLDDHYNLLHVL